MLRTYIYLPEELDYKIKQAAKTQKKSKAEVIRGVLEEGLSTLKSTNDAQTLLNLATNIQKLLGDEKLPKDLSVNHDYYLWGGEMKTLKTKP